jgi:hypothetical protein
VKNYYILLLLALSSSVQAQGSYWQCLARDAAQQTWTAKHSYQKIALNFALSSCKKGSQDPSSCTGALEECTALNWESVASSQWRCTSIDWGAESWTSTFFGDRQSAGLSALTLCRTQSAMPSTCTMNMITCKNAEGDFY